MSTTLAIKSLSRLPTVASATTCVRQHHNFNHANFEMPAAYALRNQKSGFDYKGGQKTEANRQQKAVEARERKTRKDTGNETKQDKKGREKELKHSAKCRA